MDKKSLSEREICSKYITPAVIDAGWDSHTQIREEVSFTKGRIIVRGKLHTRGEQKRADYILYRKKNIPIAVIEAKDNEHSVGDGMQQALNYAKTLGVPFVRSYNKTEPMRIAEFDTEKAWWGTAADGYATRTENSQAWKVSIEDIKARNYNLDCKNPHVGEQEIHDPEQLLAQCAAMQKEMSELRNQLKDILSQALGRES
ncbi:MAG: type I restriction enzyme HsdR N-terminal domain-containing protein [Undibacterium sp.]|nr:type I restriction enzyme HsdR N-terminal domain-containing protein [Undibacterium sp.]